MRKTGWFWGGFLAATFAFTALAGAFPQATSPSSSQAAQQPQSARRLTFRATHYEVTAALAPKTHFLTARATMDMVAINPGRTAEFEIHSDLRISNVLDAARRPMAFERSDDGKRVTVTLPQAYTNGDKLRLTVEYSGPLAENELQLPGSTRWAYIGEEGSYLLLPARWFPLTDFPGNRYSGVFELSVPSDVGVAGTGKSAPPTIVPGGAAAPATATSTSAPTPTQPAKSPAKGARAAAPLAPAEPVGPSPVAATQIAQAGSTLYTFRVEQPSDAGSFVIGSNQLAPVRAEGLNLSIFVPSPQVATAQPYGESLARIVNSYMQQFGTIWEPNLTVVQLPNLPGTPVHGYSAPGVLFIGARQWDKTVNYRLLALLSAQQWWRGEVLPAGPNDAWLGDGLARYSEAMYVENFAGKEGFLRVLEDCAVGAMMYEEATPLGQASRLDASSAEYRSVVVNKGALVFNMLRSGLGDETFNTLLRDYYAKFRGKSVRLADFQAMVAEAAAKLSSSSASGSSSSAGGDPSQTGAAATKRPPFNATAFFGQWLNSTGVPEFKLEYVVIRTQKGFKVVGKVKQDLETFRSAVEVKVETDGNPETTIIEVIGSSSDFAVETFGRPKPGGIYLDPNNYILKANPKLRVRSAIARGEALAEEGKYYEAVQQYQSALELVKNSSLAHFRMAEAFFFQKNLQASANAFRDAIDGDRDPKWIEVWAHIYLGKIFDVTGQRERAVNEYQKAVETHDDTGGAQAEAEKYLREPYKEGT